MRSYTAIIERCPDTGLYVGFIPGFPGAHSPAASLDELNANLREVVAMLLEDGELTSQRRATFESEGEAGHDEQHLVATFGEALV